MKGTCGKDDEMGEMNRALFLTEELVFGADRGCEMLEKATDRAGELQIGSGKSAVCDQDSRARLLIRGSVKRVCRPLSRVRSSHRRASSSPMPDKTRAS